MYHGGKFDVINIPMPSAGMNQNVAPEALPATQTYWLENILPVPKGNGRVRHGTKEVPNIAGITDKIKYNWEIQEIFNYTTKDNVEQLLLYVQVYVHDFSSGVETVDDEKATIRFLTNKKDRYVVDTPVEIDYTEVGEHIVRRVIIDKKVQEVDEGNYQVTLYFDKSTFITGMKIKKISYSSGSIYSYDIKTQALSDKALMENLAVNSVPRSAFFQGQLIICNGVDNIMQWNGTELKKTIAWIPVANKKKDNLVRKDEKTFTFIKNKKFNKDAYLKGAKIRLKIDEKMTELTVSNCMVGDKTIEIITIEDIPNFTIEGEEAFIGPREEDYSEEDKVEDEDRVQVMLYCQGYPPKLSYIKVMNNRVWGFGEGATRMQYRKEPMKVYFSFKPESLEYWFSDITREMPYINMSYEQGRYDSFEAISTIGSNVLFIGRYKTQVWQGRTPIGENVNFLWKSTIDGGIVHGNLLMEVGNDVVLVSPQGLTSFTMTTEKGSAAAPKLSIKPIENMDPLVEQSVKEVMTSNAKYRKCRSFNYATNGSFVGFKIGDHETIIAIVNTTINSFCVFSGSFKYSYAFNSGGKKLYMTDGNKLLEYNDDYNDPTSYTDDNVPINFLWSLPIINLEAKKYACKRFEVQAEYSSEFSMQKNNSVLVSVNGDLRKTFNISTRYPMEFQGDVLNTVSLDSGSFRLGVPYQVAKARLKFISTSFWCSLHGTISTGAFTIKNIRLYGRTEQ